MPDAIAAERDYLLRFARRRLGNRELAEDAVQSALTRALGAASRFAGRSSLRTWLTSILRNAVADAHRARIREPLIADLPGEPRRAAQPDGDGGDPAEILQARELAEAMGRKLERLPASSARAFVMHELEGRAGAEVRRRLGMSPSRYWQALHHTRQALRLLQSQGGFHADVPR
jgi:RNA polymerase sigma-70 factor (ECF subfamily)